MTHFAPIRDEAGAIVGLRPKDEASVFGATLAETMAAVGAAPVVPENDRPPTTRQQERRNILRLAAGVAAIALAIGLLALTGRATPPPASPPSPTATATVATPTATPRTIPAYWAPGGAAVSVAIRAADAGHFIGRLGEWAQVRLPGGGEVWVRRSDLILGADDRAALERAPDRSTPTPAPTPIVIIQQAPPVECWSVTLDVLDDRKYPIGRVEGASCESREAAQANAAARAEQVRADQKRKQP